MVVGITLFEIAVALLRAAGHERGPYTGAERSYTGRLVVNVGPADRALWSVQLIVVENHDVIANGARVKDERANGTRVEGYALDKPLRPYLMAFAAGALVHEDRALAPGRSTSTRTSSRISGLAIG